MLKDIETDKYRVLINRDFTEHFGMVTKVVGLTVESVGPPAKLNDMCEITSKDGSVTVMSEVVGFRDSKVLLMPYDTVDGIGLGATVKNTGKKLSVKVGDDLLGHVFDGIGRPMDGKSVSWSEEYPIDADSPDPMKRKLISEVLPLGVKAVDGLLT